MFLTLSRTYIVFGLNGKLHLHLVYSYLCFLAYLTKQLQNNTWHIKKNKRTFHKLSANKQEPTLCILLIFYWSCSLLYWTSLLLAFAQKQGQYFKANHCYLSSYYILPQLKKVSCVCLRSSTGRRTN